MIDEKNYNHSHMPLHELQADWLICMKKPQSQKKLGFILVSYALPFMKELENKYIAYF